MTILPFAPEGITIVTGHYGCGKTNLALNYALDLAADGLRPTIVDLDVVNPYFRSSDYTQQLLAHDIHVIAPNFAGSTLDTPSLSPAIAGCIEQAGKENPLILDVGGDDAGATALGQYADAIKARPYHMPYVVNRYRDLGDDVDQYVDVLHQIEQASHLQVTGIVDNSNLMQETLPAHITGSLPFARSVATATNLPLLCVTVPVRLLEGAHAKGALQGLDTQEEQEAVLASFRQIPETLYPVRVLVSTPWDTDAFK